MLEVRPPPLKNCQAVNNSAAVCSIALKFGTEFEHLTFDVLQKFKVKWSAVKVTACKRRLVAKLLSSIRKSGLLNLMAM